MAYVLDAIVKYDLIGSKELDGTINYESINSTGNTDSVSIGGIEQGLSIQVDYDNGVAANIEFVVELSVDNNSFVPVDDEAVTVTDTDGTIIWDVVTNSNFARVSWTVAAGSLDIYAQLSGRRRH